MEVERSETPPEEKPLQFSIRQLLIGVALLSVCLGLLVGWCRLYSGSLARADCANNLHQLARALQNYHDIHGTFPPASIAGPDGKPWHSWRTLIMPIMDPGGPYDGYRFDEPWNGPTNSKLGQEAPWIFRCPADQWPASDTNYLAVTGPGTMWPDGRGLSTSEIQDGPQDTIMLVEVAKSRVHWMEPRDLRINEMDFRVNGKSGNSISSKHGNYAWVVFADGHVRALDRETRTARLKSWLLISDATEQPPGTD